MGKSKKFIDRKNAVTFHLVHRSQQDPLIADENAPQHVLSPASFDKKTKASDAAKRKEEQKKYGIYFDDDYDYLQHLRDVSCTTVDWEPVEQLSSRTTNLKLPSSVFASKVEEDIGLLNRAAPHSGPRLDLDPDVVAAMDEDFDFEDPGNELEDNFIELANAEGSGREMDSRDDDDDDDDMSNGNKSEDDELGSLCGPQYTFADEETKSRFTNYSMSSSVIRRNEHLTLLDDRFEKMFTNCYGDTDIGALDCEEIEGHIAPDSEVMIQYAEKMKEECRLNQPLLERKSDSQAQCSGWLCEENTDEENDNLVPLEIQDSKQHWDCESIVSTYSNLYNRPKLITEPVVQKKIRISKKTGIPLEVLDGINGHTKLTARALLRHSTDEDRNPCSDDGTESMVSALSVLSMRPKDETPEERSERKRALRQYRKERRMERKANILAFKEEKKRQEKVMLNNRKNIHGIHIL